MSNKQADFGYQETKARIYYFKYNFQDYYNSYLIDIF